MSSERRRRSIFEMFDEYFERVEALVEHQVEALMERPSWRPVSSTIEPLTNIFIEATEVVVTADIPCTDPRKTRVNFIDEDTLEVTAPLQRCVKYGDFRVRHRRGEFRQFHTRFKVPVPVEKHEAKITCKRGVLEVRIPRKLGVPTAIE